MNLSDFSSETQIVVYRELLEKAIENKEPDEKLMDLVKRIKFLKEAARTGRKAVMPGDNATMSEDDFKRGVTMYGGGGGGSSGRGCTTQVSPPMMKKRKFQ